MTARRPDLALFPRSETYDPREGQKKKKKKRRVTTIVTLLWLWEIKLKSYTKEHFSLWHSGIRSTPQWAGDPLSFSAPPQGHIVRRGLPISWPLNLLVEESNTNSTEEKEKYKWNSSHSFVEKGIDRLPRLGHNDLHTHQMQLWVTGSHQQARLTNTKGVKVFIHQAMATCEPGVVGDCACRIQHDNTSVLSDRWRVKINLCGNISQRWHKWLQCSAGPF